jgi:nucleoside phosphorylase
MRILVVEDNYDKIQLIHDVFTGESKPIIDSCLSSSNAKTLLESELYDVLIVDIQIPDIEGGEVSVTGGIDLLAYIEMSPDIIKPSYILGLTAYSDNYQKLKLEFEQYGWLLYNINSESNTWQTVLQNKYAAAPIAQSPINADVAIITALEHTELEAVIKCNTGWLTNRINGSTYYTSDFELKEGTSIKIVAASSDRMGVSAASIVATKIGLLFNPKLMVMSGICAGVEGKVQLGDIIVADHTWDWNSGKMADQSGEIKFLPEPHQIQLCRQLRSIFKTHTVNSPYPAEIYQEWTGSRSDNLPNIHLAPMACGSQVIANKQIIDKILEGNRKMLALEMESYGFLLACESLDKMAFVAKSVCDFADSKKGDDVQEYASFTSATFVFKVIKDYYHELIHQK